MKKTGVRGQGSGVKKNGEKLFTPNSKLRTQNYLTIALPKGRILKEAVVLFKKIGIDCSDVMEDSRRLIFENKKTGVRFMVIRSQDVPTYVEYGAADVGIAGKDVLLEQERDIYEPLDLGIGFCRMVVAEPKELGRKDNPRHWTHIRVATKY
ncbi:MAG: ATP phosphoribosyltransferase, partial [Deltaproteobacteria bacterium]|nr:ATP phosphoribosyltransferase [Deltaproteobacteria bacterium]